MPLYLSLSLSVCVYVYRVVKKQNRVKFPWNEITSWWYNETKYLNFAVGLQIRNYLRARIHQAHKHTMTGAPWQCEAFALFMPCHINDRHRWISCVNYVISTHVCTVTDLHTENLNPCVLAKTLLPLSDCSVLDAGMQIFCCAGRSSYFVCVCVFLCKLLQNISQK